MFNTACRVQARRQGETYEEGKEHELPFVKDFLGAAATAEGEAQDDEGREDSAARQLAQDAGDDFLDGRAFGVLAAASRRHREWYGVVVRIGGAERSYCSDDGALSADYSAGEDHSGYSSYCSDEYSGGEDHSDYSSYSREAYDFGGG